MIELMFNCEDKWLYRSDVSPELSLSVSIVVVVNVVVVMRERGEIVFIEVLDVLLLVLVLVDQVVVTDVCVVGMV